MHTIVCVKQVPATNVVRMDPVTNTIIREGVESILNPFDAYAVEEALRLRESQGGKISALSMGIPSVTEMLRAVLALGVDRAMLLTDRAFAGADTLATANALAGGVQALGTFDLILCGKQATDGDTAQVGPMLAEMLNLPHATDIIAITEVRPASLLCLKVTDEGQESIEIPLPAVLTVVKDINIPRLPSIAGLRRAQTATVEICDAAHLGLATEKIGLKGSPTQVVRTFVPDHTVEGQYLQGNSQQQAQALLAALWPENEF